jgi:hypothetical protein
MVNRRRHSRSWIWLESQPSGFPIYHTIDRVSRSEASQWVRLYAVRQSSLDLFPGIVPILCSEIAQFRAGMGAYRLPQMEDPGAFMVGILSQAIHGEPFHFYQVKLGHIDDRVVDIH